MYKPDAVFPYPPDAGYFNGLILITLCSSAAMPHESHHPCYTIHKVLNILRTRFGAGWAAKWLRRIFAACIIAATAFLTLLQFCDEATASPELKPIISWIRTHQFPIAAGLLLIQGVSGLAAWAMRAVDEWATPQQGKIQNVLDAIVEYHFENREPDHVYRATLFREHSCWCFGRWLGIVARSGETYSGSNTIFSISSKRHSHCTGIAGECWWRAKSMGGGEIAIVLPDARNSDDGETVADYNGKGKLAKNEYEQIQVKSCVFKAIAIRRHGRVWGVLIIDSTDVAQATPDAGQTARRKRDLLTHATKTITLLLE